MIHFYPLQLCDVISSRTWRLCSCKIRCDAGTLLCRSLASRCLWAVLLSNPAHGLCVLLRLSSNVDALDAKAAWMVSSIQLISVFCPAPAWPLSPSLLNFCEGGIMDDFVHSCCQSFHTWRHCDFVCFSHGTSGGPERNIRLPYLWFFSSYISAVIFLEWRKSLSILSACFMSSLSLVLHGLNNGIKTIFKCSITEQKSLRSAFARQSSAYKCDNDEIPSTFCSSLLHLHRLSQKSAPAVKKAEQRHTCKWKLCARNKGCDPRQMRWHDTLVSTSTEHAPSPPC